jgi:hypothetical protein
MNRVVAFLRFLWDFLIGDDWRVAAGVAIAIAITALVSDAGVAAWWILPLAVAALLGMSVASALKIPR